MLGKRILVVDDEDLVLETIKLMLSYIGHTVETAACGSEALAKIQAAEFDLVLTDLVMPGMRGDRLAHEIKAQKPLLPVILLSGFPHETPPPAVDHVLLKPFSADELRKAVASFA